MMKAFFVLLLSASAAANASASAGAKAQLDTASLTTLAKSLGIDTSLSGVLNGVKDDLLKNFNLVDLFPELKSILGSDPFGLLPTDAILRNNKITNTRTLFKTPLADDVPSDAGSSAGAAAADRVDGCSDKLKSAAVDFRSKYLRLGGAVIVGYTNRHIFNSAAAECKRLKSTAAQKHRLNENQFNLGLGSQANLVSGAAKQLDLPQSSSRNGADQTTTFLNEVFEKKTGGKVEDFGTALSGDARALCRRLTDAELPVQECEELADELCAKADALAQVTQQSAFTTRQEVVEEAKKHAPEGRASGRSRSKNEAGKNCRCAGDTIRASVAKAGTARLADKCLSTLQMELVANPDRAPAPPTLAGEFLKAQSPGAEVSYEALLTPDKLHVTNLAGQVLPAGLDLSKLTGAAAGLVERLLKARAGS